MCVNCMHNISRALGRNGNESAGRTNCRRWRNHNFESIIQCLLAFVFWFSDTWRHSESYVQRRLGSVRAFAKPSSPSTRTAGGELSSHSSIHSPLFANHRCTHTHISAGTHHRHPVQRGKHRYPGILTSQHWRHQSKIGRRLSPTTFHIHTHTNSGFGIGWCELVCELTGS